MKGDFTSINSGGLYQPSCLLIESLEPLPNIILILHREVSHDSDQLQRSQTIDRQGFLPTLFSAHFQAVTTHTTCVQRQVNLQAIPMFFSNSGRFSSIIEATD